MRGLGYLAVIIGLICLVSGPAMVSAQEADASGLIDVIVDMQPSEGGEGWVNLFINWSDVEGAATYDVIIYDSNGNSTLYDYIPAPDSQIYAGLDLLGGDRKIEVIAYDQDRAEIARSFKIDVSLPQPGSVYLGEGSIRFESKYTHYYSNGTKITGEEGGKITRFYIYQELWDDGTGKKVTVNNIYGTGEASMLIMHDGEGWHTVLQAIGKFSIFGTLSQVPVPGEAAKCSMSVSLTKLYPVVYQDSCVTGQCVSLLLFDWEENHVIGDFPAIAGATREVSDIVFIEADRTTKYYLDHLALVGPAACR